MHMQHNLAASKCSTTDTIERDLKGESPNRCLLGDVTMGRTYIHIPYVVRLEGVLQKQESRIGNERTKRGDLHLEYDSKRDLCLKQRERFRYVA